MATRKPLITLALFGQPVAQSASPRIHEDFARQAGLDICYRAIETPPNTLAEQLDKLIRRGGSGCNITLPLKQEAMQLATYCSTAVTLAGAANTLILRNGQWHAETTDGPGLVADLRDAGMLPVGQRVAVIGAGGATASVLGALLNSGCKQLDIFNRTKATAQRLARRHEHLGNITGRSLDDLHDAGTFDLVINATSIGHEGEIPPLQPELFSPTGSCYDLNYGPAAQPMRDWCAANSVPYRDGLGMLVGQAAESFTLWTGFEPDRSAVLRKLSAQQR